jgi:uncharacterized membrane protein YkoI
MSMMPPGGARRSDRKAYSPKCLEGEFYEVVKIHIQFSSNSHLHPLHSAQQPPKEKEIRKVYANAINLRTLVIAAAVAMLLALGAAGIAYANGGDSEEQLTGPEAEKAKSAAIAAVGGGTVTEVERDDSNGTGAFEVEVTREDGSQLEVHLDGDYNVVGQEPDEDGPNDKDGPNDD